MNIQRGQRSALGEAIQPHIGVVECPGGSKCQRAHFDVIAGAEDDIEFAAVRTAASVAFEGAPMGVIAIVAAVDGDIGVEAVGEESAINAELSAIDENAASIGQIDCRCRHSLR